jgi:hypothetical protein
MGDSIRSFSLLLAKSSAIDIMLVSLSGMMLFEGSIYED